MKGNASTVGSFRAYSERTAGWAAIALGFSIPLSVALDNVLLLVILLSWIAAGAAAGTWRHLRGNAVALAAMVLFGVLALGMLYGERDPGDARFYLLKYLDLPFVAIFAFLFAGAARRRHAIHALAASLATVLILSYLIAAGVPAAGPLLGSPGNPVVLKQYLTHAILMAFAAFLFAQLARAEAARGRRMLWAALSLLAAANVFMTQGRTGYLVLAVLLLYGGYAWWRWRGLAGVTAALVISIAALNAIPGPFQQRLQMERAEAAPSEAGQLARTSNAERLELYRTALRIIREHPWLGVGTGGYPRAYARHVPEGALVPASRNPHNEYLLVAVQTGVPGLLALLLLFGAHWYYARRLATPLEQHVARGLVLTIAAGCLFNSLLLDHTEGLLYAWLTGVLFGGLQFRQESGNGKWVIERRREWGIGNGK